MSPFQRIILLCFALLIKPALAADPFADSTEAEFLPVTEAYRVLPSLGEDNTLNLQWSIADGYYLYGDRFATAVSLHGQQLQVSPIYEDGIEKDDPYFGLTIVYYHNTNLQLANLPPDTLLTVKQSAQGCADAGLCYPPHHWYFRVDTGSGQILELSAAEFDAAAAPVAGSGANSGAPLWWIVLMAVAGGALLNLMPCVFPVLSLKVLSFANAHDGRPAGHGLVYSAGVVLSFAVVAGALIALQGAGRAVGWGFQLQSPWFVAALSCLFFLLSLNLLGVFQISGSWINVGGDLASRSGYSGSFFTGVLATVVATPCTAPFMGTAVGFAATQPAPVAMGVFTALGAGMAAPILLLTLFPGWLRLLPKPGTWMVRLRQFLAFPLLASALWLAWVIGRQTGANGIAATVALWLVIGFLLWLWQLGLRGRITAAAVLISTSGWLFNSSVMQPQLVHATAGEHAAYSPQLLDEYRRAGKPVFLNVTADWCITCAANEAVVLRSEDTELAFNRAGVTQMVADWTLYDPQITELLAQYGRNGIPLYLLFPADPSQPAQILPQILTGDALQQALSAL